MFVSLEKNGLHTSDECFKMALTDAISVACKALGIGADIYWERDTDKYTTGTQKKSQSKATVTRRNAPPKKELPSDVLNMPGADKVDNRVLFVNALRRGKMDMSKGRKLLDEMFGEDSRINDLTREQLIEVLTALDEMVV